MKVSVDSAKNAPRVELFVRILWGIVSGIVLWFFSILALICIVFQWFYILIMGKRSMALNNILRVYLYYRTQLTAYLMLLTDERNPIIPES